MIRRYLSLFFLIVLSVMTASCAYALHGTVRPESTGFFIVSYHPWDSLIDEYGPGTENVREKIKANKYANAEQIWDEAFEEAIPRFLEAKNIMPPQCKSGVIVVHSGEAEGGNGWARFRCK